MLHGTTHGTGRDPAAMFVPALANPTSSYQPAHLSASLGGAPPFTRVAVLQRGTPAFSSASSLPVVRATLPLTLTSPLARQTERPLLLRPCRQSVVSLWPSTGELSSEDGAYQARVAASWRASGVSTAAAEGSGVDAAAAGAGAGGQPRASTAVIHGVVVPLTGDGGPLLVVPGATTNTTNTTTTATPTTGPFFSSVSKNSLCDVTTTTRYPLPRPTSGICGDEDVVEHDVLYAPAAAPDGSACAAAVEVAAPLFASPLRRAQVMERKQAEEMAQVARERVIEYLDGQVPPKLSSTHASLTLSVPSTPVPQAPHEFIASQSSTLTTDAFLSAFSPVRLPASPPLADLTVCEGVPGDAVATARRANARVTPFSDETSSGTQMGGNGGNGGNGLTATGNSSLHALRRVRCPLCHELALFCPHGVPGLVMEPSAASPSPLLHARQDWEGRALAPAAAVAVPATAHMTMGQAYAPRRSVGRQGLPVTSTTRLLVPLSRPERAADSEEFH